MNSNKRGAHGGLRSGNGKMRAGIPMIPLVALMLLSLTGCSNRSATVVLDPRLTAPVEMPELRGPTNRDGWIWTGELQDELKDCARRMNEIRQLTR